MNASLISGLTTPFGIAVSGSDLFVVNTGTILSNNGTVGEYTTSGAPINPALISGLASYPYGIAVIPTAATPEPSTLLLVPVPFIAIGVIRRAKRSHRRRSHGIRSFRTP